MKISEWKKSSNWAVLDVETTGMSAKDQVIELTLLSAHGEVVFNSLVKPTVPIHFMAAKTHGISQRDLANSPHWPSVMSAFESAINQFDVILIFNQFFDVRLIRQTYLAHGLIPPQFNTDCVMEAFKSYLIETNSSSNSQKVSLDKACSIVGIDVSAVDRHRSHGDCILTRELILKTPDVVCKGMGIDKKHSDSPVQITALTLGHQIKKTIGEIQGKLKTLSELCFSLREFGINMVLTNPNVENQTFGGVLFFHGNNKISGSHIGKNYSLNGLISLGFSYNKSSFDFFYQIFLDQIRIEQEGFISTLGASNVAMLDIFRRSEKPLKTMHRAIFEYVHESFMLKYMYRTPLLDGLHNQTKLTTERVPKMQLYKIQVSGCSSYILLKYKNNYDGEPSEFVIENKNKSMAINDINEFSKALNLELGDKIARKIIHNFGSSPQSKANIRVEQYIFNPDSKEHISMTKQWNSFTQDPYLADFDLKKDI